MRETFTAVLALGVMGGATAAWAQASPGPQAATSASDPFTLGIGGSAWSGDYGAPTDTTIAAVLLTGRYKLGPLRLSASAPWMRIESQGSVFAGVDGTPLVVSPSTGATKRVREGFGDMTLGAAYLLPTPPSWGFDIDTFARVKLATAPRSTGLSTGQTDVSAGVELTKPIGRWAPFVSLGYRDFGDTATIPLKSGFATSIGTAYVFSNRVTALVSYDHAQRSSRFVQDGDEIAAGVSAPLPGSKLRLTSFLSAGLSSGSADVAGGLSLSLNL